MSNLRIMEHLAPVGGVVPIVPGEYFTAQNVAIGGASASSAAFGSNTSMVHVQAEAICTIKFGAAPTAVAGTGYRLAAGEGQTFSVVPGQKVACISDT